MKRTILWIFLFTPLMGQPDQDRYAISRTHLLRVLFSYTSRVHNQTKSAESKVLCEEELHAALDALIQKMPEGSTVTRADFLQYSSWFLYGCMQFCEGLAQMFRLMHRGIEFMRTWGDYIPSL